MEKKERNKKSQYPHYIAIRISDRQHSDLEYIMSATGSSINSIVREALQQHMNNTIHKLLDKASKVVEQ